MTEKEAVERLIEIVAQARCLLAFADSYGSTVKVVRETKDSIENLIATSNKGISIEAFNKATVERYRELINAKPR